MSDPGRSNNISANAEGSLLQRLPLAFLVGLLVLVAIGAASYRHVAYDVPWLPTDEAQIWQVEARITLTGTDAPGQVLLTLPPQQAGLALINEAAASPGWGFAIEAGPEQRRAHWTRANVSGPQVLFYKLDFAARADNVTDATPPAPATQPTWDEPYSTAARSVLQSAAPLAADAHSLTVQLIQHMQQNDQNINLLLDQFTTTELLTQLLQTANHSARRVQVLRLEDGRRRSRLTELVQVWTDDHWRLYDPASGYLADTRDLLLWQTGAPAVLEVVGGSNSRVRFSVSQQTRSALILAQDKAGDLALSLYNLPIAEQGMFKLIMLLPVGALVVVLLRILVGIRTAGTFMPVLIALAFLQTQLLPGLTSFILVVALGLGIRSYLSSLNLLLVARIATLVVIVIGMISLFSVVSYRLGLLQGLSITFFPMIILAWTIERMSIVWEEEGPKEVILQGGGSLLVAVLAYLLMDLPVVRHLAFNFPELHLLVLAIILLTGRYTGYRLLELRRFAAFNQ
ncbi:MAG: inactive transglutaminase family protein [Pseudomonadota bacterium]